MPNITAVKVKNRRPSRHRKINRITVIGGEKSLHSADKRKLVMNTPSGRVFGQLPGGSCSLAKWAHSLFSKEQRRPPLRAKIHTMTSWPVVSKESVFSEVSIDTVFVN